MIAEELFDLADDLDVEVKVNGRQRKDLDWSVHCRNAFRAEGIVTLAQLARKIELELIRVPNVGRKSLREIKEKLTGLGLKLRS